MFQIIKENPKAAAAALLMHLAIILFLIVGVDWLETPKPVKSGVEVVQARMVDPALVSAELEKLKQAETNRESASAAAREQEEKQLEDLRSQQQDERRRLEELEQQRRTEEKSREAEAEKKQQIERQRKAEEQRLAEVQARRQAEEEKREQAEARRQAEQKKRDLEEAKRKAAAESQRKAELEQKRKTEAARRAEAERKAAEERKRKAEAARKAREAELEAAMEAEHNARVRDRFMLQIQQKVIGNWVRLEGTGEGLKCKLRVRLAKGGNVLAVSVIESSGSGTFDRSAEAAVYKADPLPVPEDNLFEQFRDIIFVFEPNR